MSKRGTIKPLNTFQRWWKHLRPYGKRVAAKKERKDAKQDINNQT